MRATLRLLRTQVRASLLQGLQYRVDFILDGLTGVFWTASAILPLVVVFRSRPTIAGWSFGEALMVTGWFTFLEGVLEGAVNPSLADVVEHIRKGTFDFVLLKPADAQFLVSTARLQPWRATNVAGGRRHLRLGVPTSWVAARRREPLAAAAVAMTAAVAILYSLKTLAVSAAFYVVRVDNLAHLFDAVFDAARWPASIFRGRRADRLHLRDPARAHDHLPGAGPPGDPARCARSPSRSRAPSARSSLSRAVWTAAIARLHERGRVSARRRPGGDAPADPLLAPRSSGGPTT